MKYSIEEQEAGFREVIAHHQLTCLRPAWMHVSHGTVWLIMQHTETFELHACENSNELFKLLEHFGQPLLSKQPVQKPA